ncbi:MAG: hypothetical protein JWQ97_994 [Phenylobacterium sp.]|nr:hypothetical protein [Phenylobacterium sp.]
MTAPTDTPAVSEREGLIERLLSMRRVGKWPDELVPLELCQEAAAALASSEAEVKAHTEWRARREEEIEGRFRELLDEIGQLTKERDEAREGESRWLIRIHNIRYASGVGAKPMLAELPGAIAARIEAAEARATQAWREAYNYAAKLTQAEKGRDDAQQAARAQSVVENRERIRADKAAGKLADAEDRYNVQFKAAADALVSAEAAEASLSRLKADVVAVLERALGGRRRNWITVWCDDLAALLATLKEAGSDPGRPVPPHGSGP